MRFSKPSTVVRAAMLLIFVLTACSARGADEQTNGAVLATPAATPVQPTAAAPAPDTPAATEAAPSPIPETPTEAAAAPVEAPATTELPAPTGAPTLPGLPDPSGYVWRPYASGLQAPVGLANAGDGSGRLFALEQPGRIRLIGDGQLAEAPFLDIRDRVGSQASEQGLLGLAFHPRYTENGFFYVNYTAQDGNTVIARYAVAAGNPDQADPNSEVRLLTVEQPYGNHNGGVLAFGPDGYLYLGLGDGGSGGDPLNQGQSLNTLLGKVLRIDVDRGEPYAIPADNPFTGPDQRAEIWAYGLRNPWRFSFDRLTGDLFIADVGQNAHEEVNFQPAGSPGGENYGWNIMEGFECFNNPNCDTTGLTQPVLTYPTRVNGTCSVIGGYVYRGSLPDWQGVYLFGDYCSGDIWGLLRSADGSWQQATLFQDMGQITSFGQDEAGEIYFADHNGEVYRLEAATPTTGQAPGMETQPAAAKPAASQPVAALQAAALQPDALVDLAALADAPHYTLELQLGYPQPAYNGRAVLDYTNTEGVALDRLVFRLLPNGGQAYGEGSLTVDELLVAGQALPFRLTQNDSVLEVSLPAALGPGERTQVELSFTGGLPPDTGPELTSGYGIFSQSAGTLVLSGWYPLLAVYEDGAWRTDPVSNIGDSVYSDASFYEVTLIAPDELVVAASGVEVERQAEGEMIRYHLSSGPAREFTLALSPDFQVTSVEVDGIRVNSYHPADNAPGGRAAAQITAGSLEVFNRQFGPYPYRELDVVAVPMRYAAGVEFPGLILIRDGLLDNPQNSSFVITTAHEAAHQWWYNVVGNDVFGEPWVDEALTTYSSGLYFEFVYGPDYAAAFFNSLEDRYMEMVQAGRDDRVTQPLTYFEQNSDPGMYSMVVYTKGALFFRAVREEIGDRAFFTALQVYYREHQFEHATGPDLLAAFESAAGRELDELYDEWLYSPRE